MKTMKKSMFITTIMMVVLLVVALSTATFAWYTAQSSVSSAQVTLTSGTSSSASLAISDTNNGAAAKGSKVTFTLNNATSVLPMVPKASPTAGTTETAAFAGNFFTAAMNNAGNFMADGSKASPATIASISIDGATAKTQDNFYVINTNGSNKTGVTVTVTIDTTGYTVLTNRPNDWATAYFTKYYVEATAADGENEATYKLIEQGSAIPTFEQNKYYVKNDIIAADLRVAVFADGKYVSTWAMSGETVKYGTITANASASLTTVFDDANTTASGSAASLGDFDALQGKSIQIVAWYDGVGLVVDDAGLPAVFSLAFNAVAATTEG